MTPTLYFLHIDDHGVGQEDTSYALNSTSATESVELKSSEFFHSLN
jgi:hypothetical protein